MRTGFIAGYEYVHRVIDTLTGVRLNFRELHRKVKGSNTTLKKVVNYLVKKGIIQQFKNQSFPFQHWLTSNGG